MHTPWGCLCKLILKYFQTLKISCSLKEVLLPLIGYLIKINLQTINIIVTYCFLNILCKHILKFQSRVITYLLCASLSVTMVVQFHYNFGSYPDILCYFLLLLAFINKERTNTPYIYFFLRIAYKRNCDFYSLIFFSN